RQLTAPCELQLCLRVGSSTSDGGWRSFRSKPTGAQTEFLKRSRHQLRYVSWPHRSLPSRWRELYEFWLRAVADLRYWGSGRLAIHDSASGCSLGGAHGLDQSFRLPIGFHGICLGGGRLHSWRLSRIRCRSTTHRSRPYNCRPANCPNCHWLTYGCMPRRRWGRAALARGIDR